MKRAKIGIGDEEALGDKDIGRKLDEEEVWEQETPVGGSRETHQETEEEGKWKEFGRQYSEEEKTLLYSKVIMVAIEVAFSSHIYTFHNELFRQLVGGAIGSRLTGEVCKVVMDVWIRRILSVLESNQVEVYLLLKYVDDVNLMVSIIKEGLRWRKLDILDGRT